MTHGVNVFNDEFLTDYSAVSPQEFWLMPALPIMEMGVLDLADGAVDAARITADTDLDLPVATVRSFADNFNPGGDFDPEIFNRPLDEIGTSFFGYTDLTERVLPVPAASQSRSTRQDRMLSGRNGADLGATAPRPRSR